MTRPETAHFERDVPLDVRNLLIAAAVVMAVALVCAFCDWRFA